MLIIRDMMVSLLKLHPFVSIKAIRILMLLFVCYASLKKI